MESKTSSINDGTSLPIKWFFGMVVALGGSIVSIVTASIYVTSIDAKNKALSDLVMGLDSENKRIARDFNLLMKEIYTQNIEIDRRLSRIEGKLGVK